MTSTRLTALILTAGLTLGAGTAQALEVFAFPPTGQVSPGETFTLELYGNFDGDPTLGGGIDILFTPGDLMVLDVTHANVGDPFYRTLGPVDNQTGLISSLAFGHFDGVGGNGNFLIGTITFRVTGDFSATSVVLQSNENSAGPFVSASQFVEQAVDFSGAERTLVIFEAALPVAPAAGQPWQPHGPRQGGIRPAAGN